MKKALSLLLANIMFVSMFVSLCACGSSISTDSTDSTVQSTKGTRKDPYSLGDEITFTTQNLDEQQFKVHLKIKTLTEEEYAQADALREGSLDNSHKYLGIELLIESQDGYYSEAISNRSDTDGGFVIDAYTDSMSETYLNYFSHDSKIFIYDFYADVNYDLYMVYMDDGDYNMLSVEYRIGKYETATIWISLQ